ncbi:hypothetical protein ACO0LF_11260 [Undibacterium sp. Di27W]|uniref:hypothetical protein n=1 Tax=Undibacterium sp. Di27W TaxID=3413036 RepID=UPI003BF24A8B
MSKSFIQRLAVILLVIFMTNLGAWNLNSSRITHALEHDGRPEVSTSAPQHDARNTDRDNGHSAIEHQMLHAVDHLQLFPDTTALLTFHAPLAPDSSWHFTAQLLPFSTYDAPYRPPCGEPILA